MSAHTAGSTAGSTCRVNLPDPRMEAGCILNPTREPKMEIPGNWEQRMHFHRIAGILLLLRCCGWANIIVPTDPSFETPDVSDVLCGTSGYDGCEYSSLLDGSAGVGWTFTGSSGITSDGGIFGLDTPGDNNPAPDGTQSSFIQYDPNNPASFPGDINQTLAALALGQSYVLSFEAAQRPEILGPTGNFLYGGGLDFYVYWCPGDINCSVIDFVQFDNQLPTYLSFAEYTTTFTAGATSGELEFQAYDPLGGDRSDFIDDVQLDSVPEPSNRLMVLSGIGLIGFGLRRRLVRLICDPDGLSVPASPRTAC